MTPVLIFALIAFMTIMVFYWVWIGPLLRQAPTARQNFLAVHRGLKGKAAGEDLSLWQRLRYKLMGLKQRLVTILIVIAGTIVFLYDMLSPVLGNVDYTPITSKINPMYLVAFNVATPLILMYFRKLSERRKRV